MKETDTQSMNTTLTLDLLTAVQEDSSVTQRKVAQDLGVAVGLVNAYLKHCVRKGFVKVTHAPARRYAYYLTPQGFAEKSRLTVEFLSSSMSFFRRARAQLDVCLNRAVEQRWRRIALAGGGELCEVAILASMEHEVELIAVIDPALERETFHGVPVHKSFADCPAIDAIVLTDMRNPFKTYERLCADQDESRVLAPRLLRLHKRQQLERTDLDGIGGPGFCAYTNASNWNSHDALICRANPAERGN